MQFKLTKFNRSHLLWLLIPVFGALVWADSMLIQPAETFEKVSAFEEEDDDEREEHAQREEELFNMLKDPATNGIPGDARLRAVDAARKTAEYQPSFNEDLKALPNIIITARGPNNYGGRTRALGFDVSNTDIIISGGETSGIFRSINGGMSWTDVTPDNQPHYLMSVAQDTRAGQQTTWYASTGDASSSAGSNGYSYLGTGIFKSTDNGVTWTLLTNTVPSNQTAFSSPFQVINKILVHPTTGDVYAMCGSRICRSADGGTTWSQVFAPYGGSIFAQRDDIIYNTAGNKLYASIEGAGVYESTDGTTWDPIRTAAQLGLGNSDRIVLANLGATAGIAMLYEKTINCSGGGTSAMGLTTYIGSNPAMASSYTDHSQNIGPCSGIANTNALNPQGGYNMALAAKPDYDATDVTKAFLYFGGVEIYRYNTNNNQFEFIGGSQRRASNVNLHVDNHNLMFKPGSVEELWSANDGGLRSTDATGTPAPFGGTTTPGDEGLAWTNKSNGYQTHQYYGIDIHPTNGSAFVAGGAQDNAFTVQSTGATALEVGPTVDGTAIGIIDGTSNTSHNVIGVYQNGGMTRIRDGASGSGPNIIDLQPFKSGQRFAQAFHAILHLDDDNRNIAYVPGKHPTGNETLIRTRIANTMTLAQSTLDPTPANQSSTTGWEELTGFETALGGDRVSTVATSRGASYTASDATRQMYVGTEAGKVFRMADPGFAAATTAPTDITPAGATGFVSSIAVDPADPKKIMVTYANYNVESVHYTDDATAGTVTWSQVQGPAAGAVATSSVRSSAIVTVSGTQTVYFVGTSVGLFASEQMNGATTVWERVGATDIGFAVVSDMRLRTSDNMVAVGTHGNGLFMMAISAALPVEFTKFTGIATERGNRLDWTTAAELNNQGFEIERSIDGDDFETIGFVAGAGTLDDATNYTFLDPRPEADLHYYRLRQVDNDGKFEYSEVISIRREGVEKPTVALYPNPVVEVLNVRNAEGSAATLFDASGRLLRQLSITSDQHAINVADLPIGTYTLRLAAADGTFSSQRFVK